MSKNPKWPKPALQFKVPIYGSWCYLYRDTKSMDKARAALKIAPMDEWGAGSFTMVQNSDGTVAYLIGVYTKNDPTTLVHEVLHLSLAVLKRAGIDARDSGGETLCYLNDSLLKLAGLK